MSSSNDPTFTYLGPIESIYTSNELFSTTEELFNPSQQVLREGSILYHQQLDQQEIRIFLKKIVDLRDAIHSTMESLLLLTNGIASGELGTEPITFARSYKDKLNSSILQVSGTKTNFEKFKKRIEKLKNNSKKLVQANNNFSLKMCELIPHFRVFWEKIRVIQTNKQLNSANLSYYASISEVLGYNASITYSLENSGPPLYLQAHHMKKGIVENFAKSFFWGLVFSTLVNSIDEHHYGLLIHRIDPINMIIEFFNPADILRIKFIQKKSDDFSLEFSTDEDVTGHKIFELLQYALLKYTVDSLKAVSKELTGEDSVAPILYHEKNKPISFLQNFACFQFYSHVKQVFEEELQKFLNNISSDNQNNIEIVIEQANRPKSASVSFKINVSLNTETLAVDRKFFINIFLDTREIVPYIPSIQVRKVDFSTFAFMLQDWLLTCLNLTLQSLLHGAKWTPPLLNSNEITIILKDGKVNFIRNENEVIELILNNRSRVPLELVVQKIKK
eukprot:TRINITY_DN1181_c0_g1_i1.p1 TRINITY_DN1181_c0_g1~~TRINITY_DN1181_c0_g1_i1.p1  ORF type:complete len:519 (-),score=123.29 TRINITY_DN1181_c0_g1_i1:19-1530(-)